MTERPTLKQTSTILLNAEGLSPLNAELSAELMRWQRYMFFRPWYVDRKVFDAGCGEGFGIAYAAAFATEAIGYDISTVAISHAGKAYPHVSFEEGDVCDVDYSNADVVLSFETLPQLFDPEQFLKALAGCKGDVVVSAPNRLHHSPGNSLTDEPNNSLHNIEWTPEEFKHLIEHHFPGRQVRFLSQEASWPGLISPGLTDSAPHMIAVIGDSELPQWPRLGIVIPTSDGAIRAIETLTSIAGRYPGRTEFAVVSSGSSESDLTALKELEASLADTVHVLEFSKELPFGRAANAGLDSLWQESLIDYFAVADSHLLTSIDCVCEMVGAMGELLAQGQRPGLIGPINDQIDGPQRCEIGSYADHGELIKCSSAYHLAHRTSATASLRIRNLFLLIHPDCLSDIGGFDPQFGFGGWEDDDYNLRARLAGYSLWIANGAYVHHQGATTFKRVESECSDSMVRGFTQYAEKWQSENLEMAVQRTSVPEGVELFVPLTAKPLSSEHVITINDVLVDLVYEATEVDLAAWIITNLRDCPRESRGPILNVLNEVIVSNRSVAA